MDKLWKSKGYKTRLFLLLLVDIIFINTIDFLVLYIRFDFQFANISKTYLETITQYTIQHTIIIIIIFGIYKLYSSIWTYAGIEEFINIILAGMSVFAIDTLLITLLDINLPRSFSFMYAVLLMGLTCLTRFSYRLLRSFRRKNLNQVTKNIMLIGAGSAGHIISKELKESEKINYKIRCIIDDSPSKYGMYVDGVKVVGGRSKILEAVSKYSIDEIFVAIPSADKSDIKGLLQICNNTNCKMKILPGIYQLLCGEVSLSAMRDVQIEDLLGRDTIKIDNKKISQYVEDRIVLVTGGGGSIGSELCRQIASNHPKQLIIVDIYENNAYEIQQELKRRFPNVKLEVIIASVRNTHRINQIFEDYRPEIVFHAAAHKHVPLMEDSPNEAIKNNVFGTYKTAIAAAKNGVKKFVLISTDKAVNPTNIMGASKRICEMIIQMMNRQYENTEFVAVRFGNVLGSNGSVVPLFKKQIAAGGPVTVTDPNIIRFFMTIQEAVSLVLEAGAYAKGGEIFVLNMGEPVKILDLAKNLIRLSGYKENEIRIEFTGLRPGEKLYEEVLMEEEGLQETENKLIHIGKPIEFDEIEFKSQLLILSDEAKRDSDGIKDIVKSIVNTYNYNG